MLSSHADRRARLMQAMGQRSVALFPSPPELLRNGDSHYAYRQSSDLLYLTGLVEPESVLVLRPGAASEKVVLFLRPKDREREIWEGRRVGVDGAPAELGVDAAYPISSLPEKLPGLLSTAEDLYYGWGTFPAVDTQVAALLARMRMGERRMGPPPTRIIDPRRVLHEMRLHKTDDEIALLDTAADITAAAHKAVMADAAPGRWEYELQAVLEYVFRRRGAKGPGYNSIVGAGANTTCLHYTENDQKLVDGDLVLVDAGAEYHHYTADVTRTFPASGRFSPAQRQAYAVVLDAEKQAIAMTKPGVTLEQIHECAVRVLTQGMVSLGLLSGDVDTLIESGAYRRYYMHRTSHWLGMDVHDVGAYGTDQGTPRPLAAGMVLTIEPGLYIAQDDADAPAALRGVGIRIEDDVLVTATGHRVLTHATPKEIDEVEAACAVRLERLP